MRRIVACAVLVVLVFGLSVPVAHAGAATDVALALASFAVFNQIVGALVQPYGYAPYYPVAAPAPVVYTAPGYATAVYGTVVYPGTVYAAPACAAPVYATPVYATSTHAAPVQAAPAYTGPTVIHYAHGRYELQVHGGQYVWVWIPKGPPPPPPPAR
jgi:hypothetical protein